MRKSLWETEAVWRKRRVEGGGHNPRGACSPQQLEEAGKTLPLSLWRSLACWHFDLRLLGFRTGRESVAVVLSCSVRGDLWGRHREQHLLTWVHKLPGYILASLWSRAWMADSSPPQGSAPPPPQVGASLAPSPHACLCSSCCLFLHCAHPLYVGSWRPSSMQYFIPKRSSVSHMQIPITRCLDGPCGLFGRSRWPSSLGTCCMSTRLCTCPDFTDLDKPVQFRLADVCQALILPGAVSGVGDLGTILVPREWGRKRNINRSCAALTF